MDDQEIEEMILSLKHYDDQLIRVSVRWDDPLPLLNSNIRVSVGILYDAVRYIDGVIIMLQGIKGVIRMLITRPSELIDVKQYSDTSRILFKLKYDI